MTAIPRYIPGFRLVTGNSLNQIVDQVNALSGNSNTPAGNVSASNANFDNSTIGNATITTLLTEPAHPNANITAAGTNQGTAANLSVGVNFLIGPTAATAGGVLPVSVAGKQAVVINTTGNTSVVYAPAGNGTINGGSANGNLAIGAGNSTLFYYQTTKDVWAVPAHPS